jgi:hypothetical protein
MGRTRTRGLTALATATAAATVMLGGAPAGATVVESGHYADSYTFEYSDCGFDVVVQGTASGHFRVRAGKGKDASAFFVNDNFSYTETHTNPENGEFFTVTGNGVFNEVKATRVSGNVFEFTAVEAGQPFAIHDSAGNLVLRDRGSLRHHALFDTLGDDVVGAVFIEDLGTDVNGPHPGFDTDFCEIITPLIGS